MSRLGGEVFSQNTDAESRLQKLENPRFDRDDIVAARDYTSDTFAILDGVATTDHYHEPKICIGHGGRLHMVYRKATEHGVIGQWKLAYIFSDDGGRNWSTEVLLKTGTATTGFGPGSILMTPSGKLIIDYNSLIISGTSVLAPVTYRTLISTDNGKSFEQGVDIDTIPFSFARVFGRMKMIPAQNSLGYRLGVTAYHQTGTGPSTFTSTIYYSDDDGESWVEGTPFVSGTVGQNEAEFIYITETVGFAVTRTVNAELFKTTDGGDSWVSVGNMDQFSGAFDSVAPTLDKFKRDGVWHVLLGMFQRDFDRLDWVVGSVEDLLDDPNAWSGSIDANTGLGNASGYQCPAADINGQLDIEGGFGYAIIEEFVASDDARLLFSYINIIKQVPLHPREYTVASGIITLGTSKLETVINLDTEGGASTDELVTINGGSLGQILIIQNTQTTSTRDVTLKSETGNLLLNGDYTMLDTSSRIILQNVDSKWIELNRANDQNAPLRTIASGIITVANSKLPMVYILSTEGGVADDLDTINGGIDGQICVFKSAAASQDVTYKDGTGNLKLAGDLVITRPDDTITLVKQGSSWFEVSRSDNLA